MTLKNLILLFGLGFCLSRSVRAESILLFASDGGKTAEDAWGFKSTLQVAGSFFSKSKWTSNVLYDGNRNDSEREVQSTFNRTPKHFDEKNFNDELERIQKLAQSKKLGPKDKVLLVIDSHGSPSKSSELTHTITTGKGRLSLDKLKATRNVLEKAGVPFAIIDLSCFSGETQHLATERTCVISAASFNSTSTTDMTTAFFKPFKEGLSLEEVFLRARRENARSDMPLISTRASHRAEQTLSDLTRHLVYRKSDDTDEMFRRRLLSSCTNAWRSFAYLTAQVKMIEDATAKASVARLEAALKAYSEKIDGLLRRQTEIELLGKNEEKFSYSFGAGEHHFVYKWHELVSTDVKRLREVWGENNNPQASETDRAVAQQLLQVADKMEKRIGELQGDRVYKGLMSFEKSFQNLGRALEDDVKILVAEERQLYEVLYDQSRKTSPGKEACREFTL